MLLKDFISFAQKRFPVDINENFDKPGLTFGSLSSDIKKVGLACDITPEIINEACEKNCDLLFTHHPLFFSPQNLVGENSVRGNLFSLLVENKIAHYNAHLNADCGENGVGKKAFDVLLNAPEEASFISSLTTPALNQKYGFGAFGELKKTLPLNAFAELINKNLRENCPFSFKTKVRYAGDPSAVIKKVALLPGSGDKEFASARSLGADVYITSDLRHHPVQDQLSQNWAEERIAYVYGTSSTPLNIIEVPHSAVESLWLSSFADELKALGLETYLCKNNTDAWKVVDAK